MEDLPDVIRYKINGLVYCFGELHYEAGVLRGYCERRKKWAWLKENHIQFDDEWVIKVEKVN